MPQLSDTTVSPTPRSFWVFVLVGAPILALAAALFYANLGFADNGLMGPEVIAPVAALMGALFVLMPRLAGVTGTEALLGYVVAGLLTIPWLYGALFVVFGFGCLTGSCPSIS